MKKVIDVMSRFLMLHAKSFKNTVVKDTAQEIMRIQTKRSRKMYTMMSMNKML